MVLAVLGMVARKSGNAMGPGGGATGSNAIAGQHLSVQSMFIPGNPVTTVNRAVGVLGRLEDSQERLGDGGKDHIGSGGLVLQPTTL